MRCAVLFVALCVPSLLIAEDAKILKPEEAAKSVGEKVVVQFEVKSVGGSSAAVYLNSLSSFRDKENLGIVIFRSNLGKFKKADIEDPAAHYKGKTIQVSGTVSTYRQQPQIKVDDPEQIKIVTEDEEPQPKPTRRAVRKAPKK
jgi:DNA/RNA endonuclease YhcR with UshA esterase domain